MPRVALHEAAHECGKCGPPSSYHRAVRVSVQRVSLGPAIPPLLILRACTTLRPTSLQEACTPIRGRTPLPYAMVTFDCKLIRMLPGLPWDFGKYPPPRLAPSEPFKCQGSEGFLLQPVRGRLVRLSASLFWKIPNSILALIGVALVL